MPIMVEYIARGFWCSKVPRTWYIPSTYFIFRQTSTSQTMVAAITRTKNWRSSSVRSW
jgi:hypothetical protein